MVPRPRREHAETARKASQSVYRTAIDVVLTGVTVIFPIVVTIYVLQVAFGFIVEVLTPIVHVLQILGVVQEIRQGLLANVLIDLGIYADVSAINTAAIVAKLIAAVSLVVLVVVVGAIAHFRHGDRLVDFFDYLIMSIPGIGAIYKSFRRMGDAMLDSEANQFRSVKLVEFPHDDTYVIGFETSESPPTIHEATDNGDMVTLFIPLAPNPVMGGFLTHMPRARVTDLNMSVEAGIRSIITSGIAHEEDADDGIGEFGDFSISKEDIMGFRNDSMNDESR